MDNIWKEEYRKYKTKRASSIYKEATQQYLIRQIHSQGCYQYWRKVQTEKWVMDFM
jgi:hypothetical protein